MFADRDLDGPVPRLPLDLDITVGVGLVGFAIALFFYGITAGQALLYLGRYGREPSMFWTRCCVTGVWILDTAHTIFLSVSIFYYCVSFHRDPAQFNQVIWPYGAVAISAESSTLLVRLGYAYRIWKFNKRRALLPMVVAMLALFLMALGLLYGIKELEIHSFDQVDSFEWSFYVAFAANLMADVIIAASMLSLFRGFFTGVRRFDVVVQALNFYVVNTGVLSIILTTLSMVMFILWPATFLYISCYWLLAKMHACSFLAVVNAEKELAARAISYPKDSPPMFTTALRVDDEHTSWADGREMMELTTYSGYSSVAGSLRFSEPTEIVEIFRKSRESSRAPSIAILA